MADLLFDENSSEFDMPGGQQDDAVGNQHQQKSKASTEGDRAAAAGGPHDDPELESIRQKVREMEAEAERLRMMQSDMEKPMMIMGGAGAGSVPSGTALTDEERLDTDSRSVYVGNVDYGATAEELETHFHSCGAINRITILCNKFTGQPKGFAYVEFAEKDSVEAALALDESLFRSRSLKVMPKRTNTPGLSSTNRPPRGRFRGRMARMYGAGGGMAPRGMRGFRRRPPPYWYAPY